MKKIILLVALMTFAFIAKSVQAQSTDPKPIVHAVMFWMDGCPHCEEVIQNVLPPLREKYDAQFELLMIEVVTTQDIDTLYRVAASYNIPKEQTGVPFLIIGDQVLVGSDQVSNQLSGMIEYHLAQGGVDPPSNPVLAGLLPQTSPVSSPTSEQPAVTEPYIPEDPAPLAAEHMQSNGFTLAVIIMVGMVIVLLCSIISFAVGKTFFLPARIDWLIPTLIFIGISIAGYLSYVGLNLSAPYVDPLATATLSKPARMPPCLAFCRLAFWDCLGILVCSPHGWRVNIFRDSKNLPQLDISVWHSSQ